MRKHLTVDHYLQACIDRNITLDESVAQLKAEAKKRGMSLAAVIYQKLDAKLREAGL